MNISTLRGKYWPKVSIRAEWTAVNQELSLFIRSILSSMRREEFGRNYDYKVDVSDRACIYLQMKGLMVKLWIPSRSRCCALFFISLCLKVGPINDAWNHLFKALTVCL